MLALLTVELDFVTRGKGKQEEIDAAVLSKELIKRFSSQVGTAHPLQPTSNRRVCAVIA